MNTERIYFFLEYLPTLIRHFYHGSEKDRNYDTRHNILIQKKYDPNKHLKYNKDGLLKYSKECPEKLKNDLYEYFTMTKEDE